MRSLRQFAVIAVLAGVAHATDIAVLQNGFSIRHESRTVSGPNTRLSLGGEGFIDVPTDQIVAFEHDDTPLRPATTPTPPRPSVASTTATTFDLNSAVSNASGKHLIDPDLIHSIIRQESGGRVRAVSPKGAQGLMQLMPGTASQLGVNDAFDGNSNVEAGTRYFRELLARYNGDMIKALAAYNAGAHRVDRYKGVPPFSETRRYVAAIVRDFNRKKLAQRSAAKKAVKKQIASANTGGYGGAQ